MSVHCTDSQNEVALSHLNQNVKISLRVHLAVVSLQFLKQDKLVSNFTIQQKAPHNDIRAVLDKNLFESFSSICQGQKLGIFISERKASNEVVHIFTVMPPAFNV